MGSNDSLAGLDMTTGEELSGEAKESRSEGSRRRKSIRGAPPSSLSQPILSDHSRSSSPSKSTRTPSNVLTKNSSSSKSRISPAPVSSRPFYNTVIPLNEPRDNTSSFRGKPSLIGRGRAAGFRHRLLPRSAAVTAPSSRSFQPQFPSPESHYTPSSYRAFEFKTPAPISPITEISAQGEISSFSSQQPSDPPTLILGSPTIEDDSANMSSTIESTSTQTFHPGTDGSYEGSPMARLILQYQSSSDEDISTYQRATNLSAKKSLLRSEIVELMGPQKSYSLHPSLMGEVTQIVNELQIFLERTSALIPERTSYFKVDPKDTFLTILKESSDIGQIHAAWMGLARRLSLAQENLVKYEAQYRSPLPREDITMPTSPISTDVGIYEAMDDLDDLDVKLRYLYDNVPHHQDQIKSPRKLTDGTSWSEILSLPSAQPRSPRGDSNRLPTIVEYSTEERESRDDSQKSKGKRRITDEFSSPPTSPRVLNIGYGTPFKSSSQFFTRPGGIALPPPETASQQNVLLGLALPHTPAFENIATTKDSLQSSRDNTQI